MRARTGARESRLICRRRRVGFLARLLRNSDIIMDAPAARRDGTGDQRACKTPKNDKQHRECNCEPEDLARKGLRVERGKSSLVRWLLRRSGDVRLILHHVNRMISAITNPNR